MTRFGPRKPKKSAHPSPQTYWECIKEYFDEALLHGYRYVTEKRRPKSEQGFWAVFLLLMIAGMSYFVIEYYVRFIDAPTITSQQPIRVPITKIPFPAVLVCPGSRLNKTAVLDLATKM